MKIKLLKDKGRMGNKGQTVDVRSREQAQSLVDAGDAETDETEEPETAEGSAPETQTTANTLVSESGEPEVVDVDVADAKTGKTVKQKVATGRKRTSHK